MKIAVNFSDINFRDKQKYNTKTAYRVGGFDHVHEYSPSDIDENFASKFNDILSKERGGGYWLWKPYFINKVLQESNHGDYIFYCDAGSFFINKVDFLINQLEKDNLNVMLFETPLIEQQWTNNYTINYLSCNHDKYKFSNQFLASYILIKKNNASVTFVEEYLKLSTDKNLITDIQNCYSYPNIDHRHDQSILSLLAKKNNIKGYRDPSDYGKFPLRYMQKNRLFNLKNYDDNNYPVILLANRKVSPIMYKIKYQFRCLLSTFKIL